MFWEQAGGSTLLSCQLPPLRAEGSNNDLNYLMGRNNVWQHFILMYILSLLVCLACLPYLPFPINQQCWNRKKALLYVCAFIYHYMLCYNEKPSSSPSSDSLRLFWSFFFLATQSVRFLPQGWQHTGTTPLRSLLCHRSLLLSVSLQLFLFQLDPLLCFTSTRRLCRFSKLSLARYDHCH